MVFVGDFPVLLVVGDCGRCLAVVGVVLAGSSLLLLPAGLGVCMLLFMLSSNEFTNIDFDAASISSCDVVVPPHEFFFSIFLLFDPCKPWLIARRRLGCDFPDSLACRGDDDTIN